MRIGVIVPNEGELPTQLGLARMAAAAEDAGAQSLWVSDHVLMLDGPTSPYPYSPDGRQTWSSEIDYFEALTCCAVLAAATRTCRIGTAVLVLPQRGVLEVAKIAASIDQLSGGRLDLGVGAGWNAAEMRALGYDFATRGARFDEMLDALRDCWTGRPRAFRGRHLEIPPGVILHPRPLQPSGPPLLIGGMSDAALRRAASRGDGWLALAEAESFDGEALKERLRVLAELRRTTPRGATSTWADEPQAGASTALSGDPTMLPDPTGGAFRTLLKLHAHAEEAGELPRLAREAADLGFAQTIVEPPWALGIDAACATIAAVRVTAGATAS